MTKKCIVKKVSDIEAVPTSHGAGLKQVSGHAHPTMDEHFIVLSGKGTMTADGRKIPMLPDTYIGVPAGCRHEIIVEDEMVLFTIGVATD
ncbi:cupin domain-containing protein [Xylanibacter muris]|uniref:Cupin domain-containing protein n=1 Tax=Xylanibacter muris TaxID=2736290 RepID=A0ABX2AQA4_9BACT|nr:cupin domain-containing protein [Xylanibacter muris]NPD92399.1 cupin domain-containing protein [Xylanibacter muris]